MTLALQEITELIKANKIEDQKSLNEIKQEITSIFYFSQAFAQSGENKC